VAYTYPQAPVGAIFLTNCRYQHAGQILRNQFHWRLEQNTNNRNIDVVCAAFETELNKTAGLYKTIDLLRDGSCVHLDSGHQMISPSRYAGVGFARNQNGSVLNLGLDITQTSAVLTRRAVIATRRGVSSLHIPLGVDDTTIDAGVLSAAALTNLGAIGNVILNTASLGDGISVRPVIYHRGFAPEYHYVETFIAQPQVRIVRRRTVGLGE